MEEKKENKLPFNDENIEKQFKSAVEHGKKALKKGEKLQIPKFLSEKEQKDVKK